ncbi:glycosyltransferase family 2 protein [Halobaculum gomorrense]|uniref:Glycosyltransferase involved in cell wall bisynthesis n=1 Tax=Halobaculum gomorrense TaxID=43928 RepID=A0A1M5KTS6_9EURY|nr:glycosyltransferase family A protein [Halobaculum gomorrense]SHG56136.1 Glycosyltransferase involved in cell wall bisynthesis [Halobaculum gomorrense]
MELSVVVPTLNGRDRLAASLDALAVAAPDAEVLVVNGPSADGTTGMVRDRDDVDVLVEIAARNVNVARNAGIEVADGDAVAFVGYDHELEPGWREAVEDAFAEGASVVTGPLRRTVRGGATSDGLERRRIVDREVSYFNGRNVVFARAVLEDLDGFDEYLRTGGARDAAHRLAGMGVDVSWRADAAARRRSEATDGGIESRDLGWKYRALAYRLAKNYGVRPSVARRTLRHAAGDAAGAFRDVLGGDATPTTWTRNGRDVLTGIASGASDGLVARTRDRSPKRNPNGISARADRAVARYDRRT